MLHQYALHKISYCADDKAEKRFFSFIAKEGDENKHTCFVFVSDKLVSIADLLEIAQYSHLLVPKVVNKMTRLFETFQRTENTVSKTQLWEFFSYKNIGNCIK